MPTSAPEPPPGRNAEELVLYGLVVAIGAIPVVVAVAQGGTFGGEPTIGLVMLCLGLIGTVVHLRGNRSPDVPRPAHPVDEPAPGAGSRRR
jgi:hypothetical protein